MDIIQALILGVVQGITEFFPISSSGHLVVVPTILGWEQHGLVFDVALHLGTATVLLVYFMKDIKEIVLSLMSDLIKNKTSFAKYEKNSHVGFMIAVGSVPVILLGLLAGDTIESNFRGQSFVIGFLVAGTALMIAAELYYRHRKTNVSLNYTRSFIIGLFQMMALLPGISRSGATISGGMLVDLEREKATRFSFLLSIPAVTAAALFSFVSYKDVVLSSDPALFIFGYIASVISGFIAITFLLKYLKTHDLKIFIVYRAILIVLLICFSFK